MNTFGLHGAIYSTPIQVDSSPIIQKKNKQKPPGVLRDMALCAFWLFASIPALYMLISG